MKYTKNTLVSIIVPIYKQQKTIQQDLTNIDSAMKKTRWNYEIIGVIDGFVDDSFNQAKKVESNTIRIFGYEENKG